MKRYALLTLNTLALALALVVNSLSGTGYFNGKTVGDVSAQYETLITPAGYAFGIWGLIYLLLIAFVGYQWYSWIKKRDDYSVGRTGIWFMLNTIFNAAWIIVWLNGYIGISVLVILVMLLTLIVLMFRLRLEVWDAPRKIIAFVCWPICIYLGWIIVATVVNVSVYLKSIGWEMAGISEVTWTITLVIVSTLIYIFLIFSRNLREAAAVGIWALAAIAVKQWEANNEIAVVAVISSVILGFLIMAHSLRNWKTSPVQRLLGKF